MSGTATPGRQQYLDIKAQYPDAIVWFRLGDFYEMFDDDARTAAAALRITLTSRTFGKDCRVPMCGVPHHASKRFLARLVKQGYNVAICEQMSPAGARLVERQVVRVVTPGTISDLEILPAGENNYLVALAAAGGEYGLAYVDVSTGEFFVTGTPDERELLIELERLAASECLLDRTVLIDVAPIVRRVVPGDAALWEPAACARRLKEHLQVHALHVSGCEDRAALRVAAGAVLGYIERTHAALLNALQPLRPYALGSAVAIDEKTRMALLGANRGPDQATHSMRQFLTRTRTAMGARLLARWLKRPTQELAMLRARQDAVAFLCDGGSATRDTIRAQLGAIGDIERLTARIRQEHATPNELLALAATLEALPAVLASMPAGGPALIDQLVQDIDPAPDLPVGIRAAVADEGSGRLVQRGYDAALDRLLAQVDEAREQLARLETSERERTGIRSLKVAYNQVFGYYIEVTQTNLGRVPAHYVRKQTLAHAERFICPELTHWEARLQEAQSEVEATEKECYTQLLRQLSRNAPRLLQTGAAIALLDVLCALAEVAEVERFVRPEVIDAPGLSIRAGRHPLVEATAGRGSFIPNDCVLGGERPALAIVTGPNMGGKSTYLRQVALIVFLAHIGSFVPAAEARIGIVDRIFARIGAHDDIEAGQSTFLVEMAETAAIVRLATSRSLILLDEIGRGTTSIDGIAIAQAVAEHLHDIVGAPTLFATHYYDLARTAEDWSRACNLHVQATEQDGKVVFLYKVDIGIANQSYAVHVARMAGMPDTITARAAALVRELQSRDGEPAYAIVRQQTPVDESEAPGRLPVRPALRIAEDAPGRPGIMEALLKYDLASMTPIDALNALYALQQQARSQTADDQSEAPLSRGRVAW